MENLIIKMILVQLYDLYLLILLYLHQLPFLILSNQYLYNMLTILLLKLLDDVFNKVILFHLNQFHYYYVNDNVLVYKVYLLKKLKNNEINAHLLIILIQLLYLIIYIQSLKLLNLH